MVYGEWIKTAHHLPFTIHHSPERSDVLIITISIFVCVALAERMASPLQRLAPPSAAEARKVQKELMHAGFRSESAPIIYRATQLLSLVFFPAAVAFGCAVLGRPLSSALVWIVVAVAVGGYLPRFVLKRLIKSRQLLL